MSLKIIMITASITALGLGCSDTKFKGTPESADAAKSDDAVPSTPLPTKPVAASLTVSLAASEIRSGAKTVQATATVKGAKSSKVTWTLEGPSDTDIGTISATGLYTSPQTLKGEIVITVVATLVENKKISDSKMLKVIPAEQIFVGCNEGSSIFPILAEVYELPKNTERLPDFSAIAGGKSTTVCMDQYNVPTRSFNEGFPGVTDLKEWFALHTTGKLIVTTEGSYTFRLNSDDGSKLYIDGVEVVDNDQTHSTRAKEGTIVLKPGSHTLVLDYFQGPADQIALELLWKGPDASDFVIVPTSAFEI